MPVAGEDSVCVAEGNNVSVIPVPVSAEDDSISGGNHRPSTGQRGEILAGVQPPLLIYGMETTPKRRGEDVALLKGRPSSPRRGLLNVDVGAVDDVHRGGHEDADNDDRDRERREDDHRRHEKCDKREEPFHGAPQPAAWMASLV